MVFRLTGMTNAPFELPFVGGVIAVDVGGGGGGVVVGISSNTGLSIEYVTILTGDLDLFILVKRFIKLTVVDAVVLDEFWSFRLQLPFALLWPLAPFDMAAEFDGLPF